MRVIVHAKAVLVDKYRVGSKLREIILGWQDGLVNVLGVILGVAAATNSIAIVIAAGMAANFAESISMAAVAYTSAKAARDYYQSELKKESDEIKDIPETERREIERIYSKKGFKGRLLNQIVNGIISSKRLWLQTMMCEELKLSPEEFKNPLKDATIVGFSAVLGSFIPLIPFLFLGVSQGIIVAILLSAFVLFISGAVKAKITIGGWIKSGAEMAAIGTIAALIAFAIGFVLKIS